MSFARIKAWHKHFREGWVPLAMMHAARSGAPKRITDDIVQFIDGLLMQDRRVTVKALAAEFGLSVWKVQTVMTERLNLRKMCAQSVPHSLQPQQEACRMAHYLDHLLRYVY